MMDDPCLVFASGHVSHFVSRTFGVDDDAVDGTVVETVFCPVSSVVYMRQQVVGRMDDLDAQVLEEEDEDVVECPQPYPLDVYDVGTLLACVFVQAQDAFRVAEGLGQWMAELSIAEDLADNRVLQFSVVVFYIGIEHDLEILYVADERVVIYCQIGVGLRIDIEYFCHVVCNSSWSDIGLECAGYFLMSERK